MLVAVGRSPYTEGLGLDKAGIAMEKNFVKVNEYLETSVKGIYAIGDVIGNYMLAHVATAEGETAAVNCLASSTAWITAQCRAASTPRPRLQVSV